MSTHGKRSGIEMNETLSIHRQRTKWTADIELDKKKKGDNDGDNNRP